MDELFISLGGPELLDEVGQLWELLNAHHISHSPHFPEQYVRKTFAAHKAALLGRANGSIGVILALDAEGMPVSYCICTVQDKIGEIESLFVQPGYRSCGLGDLLMRTALAWLAEQGVTRTRLAVAAGNEQVFGFYARHGFYPAKVVLEQKE